MYRAVFHVSCDAQDQNPLFTNVRRVSFIQLILVVAVTFDVNFTGYFVAFDLKRFLSAGTSFFGF